MSDLRRLSVFLPLLLPVPALAQGSPPAAPPGVPVETAPARSQDVPEYLTGIGMVQAFQSVTIRAQVDGQLQQLRFTEGQAVHRGDVLAVIDPRPYQAALDEAIAKRAQDQAQLANAQSNLQRDSALAQRDFASRQDLDARRAAVAQFQAMVQGDEAAIENARTELGYTNITAPIDGVLGLRLVDQGNLVRAAEGTGIVVINQMQPISAIFTLPEDSLPGLRAAMAAGPVPVEASARTGGPALARGSVALVDNQIAATTGTIRVKATFANADGALWPGQAVTGRLTVRVEHGALTVPSAAIQRGPNGLYVYLVPQDRHVAMRPVQVARMGEGVAVIASGLQEGDTVVTSGQYRLTPGALVQPSAPASTPMAAVPAAKG